MIKLISAVALAGVIVGGCGSAPGHDLDAVQSNATIGMNEVQVTKSAGVPDTVEVHGDVRDLRYNAKTGTGYVIVTLTSNIVTDIRRRD